MIAALAPNKPKQPYVAGIRLLARLARVAERACQGSGISLPQYRLLVAIAEAPQRASELADHVGVSRPTLTSLVDGLERGGFLRRRPVASDRRGIRLEPTAKGIEAVARAEDALTERLLELVDPETAETVREVVAALDSALDGEHPPRSRS